MNKVAAVVVTYNRIDLLKQCVEALLKQKYPCDILLVNNNSTDGTEEWSLELLKKFENIKYHNTGANLGGAGGFNFGMRWAVEAGYEFVWVMDDDCISYEDTLEELMNADQILEGNYGWLSSVALWKDDKVCMMNRQKLHESFYTYVELIQYGLVQAKQATFVSLLLNTSLVKRVGLPIKEFFIWGDDIEYTRRIAVRYKIPCFLVGRSKIVHMMEKNTGSSIATDSKERISRYNYAFRNENFLYRKEGWKGILYYLAKCFWNLIKIFRYSKDSRFLRCYAILHCMFKGLFFNPDIEKIHN